MQESIELSKKEDLPSFQISTDPSILQSQFHSAPKTESGAIDLTKAHRIAEGGTHVLYRFPDAPYVIKVMKQNPDAEELEILEKKYAVLYECFDRHGKQRCIREQHFNLPVLLPGKEIQISAVSLVPYEPCFKAKVKFDFKMEPAELDPYLIEHHGTLFAQMNQTLIHKESAPDFHLKDYEKIDPRIGAILQRLETDPSLRDVMVEFLNHYRDFYQRTDIIMDAMGFENILFYKDEQDTWQFKVGSVIKHDTGKHTQELFDAIHHGHEVDFKDFVTFTHAYFSPANIRAVNVCALKLGLEPVIHNVSIDSKDLVKVAQALSIPQRMLAYARHGDFEKIEHLLQEHKNELSFNLEDFWAWELIADEYIKQGESPKALEKYLNTASELPLVLPTKLEDAQRVQDARIAMMYRKQVHDAKHAFHAKLTDLFKDTFVSSNQDNAPMQTVTQNYKKELQATKSGVNSEDTRLYTMEL